jgi:hypothetical protein
VSALRANGLSLQAPAPGENIAYFEFSKSEIENLAQAEHERWMARKRLAGWKYGATRNESRRTHPAMAPWDELPDGMQEWSRHFAREMPKILTRAGFRIVKR